jgi:hypothetical protein
MRAVLPVFLVVLGLSAREYIDLNVPGGLAYADQTAIVSLARETASAGIEWANPSWRNHRHSRSVRQRKRQHARQTEHAQLGPIYRIEMRGTTYRREQSARRRMSDGAERGLRGFGQRDRSAEPDRPVEITFVVPVERKAEAALRRGGRGEHRRR